MNIPLRTRSEKPAAGWAARMACYGRPAGRLLAVCVAGWMASSGTANAGDELYGWRGFYVGAFGTYSFINQDIKFNTPTAVTGSASLDGIGGTGLVGYRIPIGSERYRIGIELDGTVGDHHGGFNKYRFTTDYWTSIRGTLGWHIRPDLLWFGTAGVSFMGINNVSAALRTGISDTSTGLTPVDRRTAKTVFGGVVGTGLEWDMGRAIHLRGDYLFGGFERHRSESAVADKFIHTDGHQVRLGIVVSLQNPYDEPHGREDIDHDRYGRGPLK